MATGPREENGPTMTPMEQQLRLNYSGVVHLLCRLSVYVPEDERQCIIEAVENWCEITGWSWRRVMDRIEVEPPAPKKMSNND